MDQEPDVIRRRIDETRSSLTEKLETLEEQVRGTVQSARETVTDTIENVRHTVQETVGSVKESLNLRVQTERHPWAMVGGACAAGFLVGWLLPVARRREGYYDYPEAEPYPAYRAAAAPSNLGEAGPARPSWLSGLLHQFDDEIAQLKGLAIGTAVAALRDTLKPSLPPQMAEQFDDVMNRTAAKMGGHPMREPVLRPHQPREGVTPTRY